MHTHVAMLDSLVSGGTFTTKGIDAGGFAGLMPEFVGIEDAVRLFGVGRSSLYEWLGEGKVKSHLIRRPGNKTGRRLVSTVSLRTFIQSFEAALSDNHQTNGEGK